MTTDTDTLREFLAAATPGPWVHYGDHLAWPSEKGPAANDPIAGTTDAHDDGEYPNAALIVAAVNALPDLLDERDRMLATIARVEALAHDLCDFNGGHGDYLSAGRSLRAALAGEGA